MFKIISYSISDNARFSFKPTIAGFQTENFESQKGPDGKFYVISLSFGKSDLRAFRTAKLFETSVILFNSP